jgi:Amt family ammonium transporter
VIALAIEKTIGLRVTVDDELTGLDQSQHAESAYAA